MKKLLFVLALGLSQLGFAQQSAVVDLHVLLPNGNPVQNQVLTVYDFSTGSSASITIVTDVNGRAVDSMAIGSVGTLYCDIYLNGCADTVQMNYTPNNGPIVNFTDTLYICGSGSMNCNFAYGASSSPANQNLFNFWHQANGISTMWDFGDGTTSIQANPTHTYTSPGTYVYCVTVDSCPPLCDTIVITGTPPTFCNALFSIDSAASQPGNVVVWNTSTPVYSPNSMTQYLWDFGDGTTSTLPFPSYTYAGPGTYTLCLTITVPPTATTSACSSMYCDTLKVDSLGNIIQKSTGVSITLNVYDPATIGLEESDIASSKIFPNPASDFIKIEFDANTTGKVNIELLSLNGAVLNSVSSNANSGLNTLEIDLRDVTAGIYFIKISKDGTNHFEKVIIQ